MHLQLRQKGTSDMDVLTFRSPAIDIRVFSSSDLKDQIARHQSLLSATLTHSFPEARKPRTLRPLQARGWW
jgi:hypothetical protein